MSKHVFTDRDLEQLKARGIPVEEAERQLNCFRNPPAPVAIDRPCTVGDGILQVADRDIPLYATRAESARLAGRLMKFVPASGAASRMFQSLQAWRAAHPESTFDDVVQAAQDGDPSATDVQQFLEGLERFAFLAPLSAALSKQGVVLQFVRHGAPVESVLAALLDSDGLNYNESPKGLILFHRYDQGARTAFEEQLVEGGEIVRDAEHKCRLHFTVSPEHQAAFEQVFRTVRIPCEARCRASFAVDWSVQAPSTDTIAVDPENRPFRTSDGKLLFRPSGHGALLRNLSSLGGDVIFIKNIDNVVPDWLRVPTIRWKQILGGVLLGVQTTVFRHLSALASGLSRGSVIYDALQYAERELQMSRPKGWKGLTVAAQREWLIDRLNRPIRVCGMVRNTGEPGGGPFWVRHEDGSCSRQIVEQAQLDPDDAQQQKLFRASTYFNPVDVICSVRDWNEDSFDLDRFVDPNAVFIASKSYEGRELKVLERPGLWNGAMAGWITVFVEVPLETFTPVKTVNDLLRPTHQPAGGN